MMKRRYPEVHPPFVQVNNSIRKGDIWKCAQRLIVFPDYFRILKLNDHSMFTVHGGWSEWNAWNNCSKICEGGDLIRTRVCNNPKPSRGGNNCTANGSNNIQILKNRANYCKFVYLL